MLMIPIPKDIREYEPKFVGPFTFRQAICIVAAGLIEFGGVKFQTEVMHLPVASYIPPLILVAIPLFFGWGEITLHMKPETYLRMVLFNMINVPKNRPYKSRNMFDQYEEPKEKEAEPVQKEKRSRQYDVPPELMLYE